MTDAAQRAILLADIGGTHARFAVLSPGNQGPQNIVILRCAEYPTLVDAVEAYISRWGGPRPLTAVMAVATPVEQDEIKFTNHVWSFSIAATKRQLELHSLQLINDFTALALALPYLQAHDLVDLSGAQTSVVDGAPVALIGPGTGLGVSGLIAAGPHWIPLAGEGGHVTYGGADEGREQAVVGLLTKRFGHLSAERMLSGPGLVNIHAALTELDGCQQSLPANRIAELGLDDACPVCCEALEMFCAALGTIAGNLALTLGAKGGVYIGGGIVPKILPLLIKSDFRRRFEQHGRMQAYLKTIPCYAIVAEQPALIGVMQVAKGKYGNLGLKCAD